MSRKDITYFVEVRGERGEETAERWWMWKGEDEVQGIGHMYHVRASRDLEKIPS